LALCFWTGGAAAQAEQDRVAPTVQVVYPAANDIVRGVIKIEVAAADDLGGSGVARIELLVNQHPFGFVESPADRVLFEWNSLYVPDGPADISARAVDAAGNEAPSPAVRVVVDNLGAALTAIVDPSQETLPPGKPPDDTVPPWVAIAQPATGKSVSGGVSLEAYAVDNSQASGGTGITSVEFWVQQEGKPKKSLGNAALAANGNYAFNWTTARADDGDLLITAIAKDGANNQFESAPIRLRVDNVAPELHPVRTDPVVQPWDTPAKRKAARPLVFLWTSPPVLHDGTVTIYMTFDKPDKNYTAMDATVPPQVQLRLPNAAVPLRNVAQLSYYGERGFWIGTVAVNAVADGLGTAIVEVRNARDVAGNTMAPNLRAGYIQLEEANPRWPVPHHDVMTNVGMTYRIEREENAGKFRIHEGVDLYEDHNKNVPVKAIRAGKVASVVPVPNGVSVNVEVVAGHEANNKPISQYDNYEHLKDVVVNKGGPVKVGDVLGYVCDYYKNFGHTHIEYGYEVSGMLKYPQSLLMSSQS
jgi:hypothetical protein